MNQNIKNISETFQTHEDFYNQLIEKGIETCCYLLDHDCVWKRLELQWLFEYFLQKEEYEKCAVLKNFIKTNFIAPDEKQAELNKKLQFIK
jgi:hypothetical protein